MRNFFFLLFLLASHISFAQNQRAPAYPLITHTPYFSIWSTSDKLNGSATTHWTGTEHSLNGLLKVDGKLYNFLGRPETKYEPVLPASDDASYSVDYTEEKPADNWYKNDFVASGWKKGEAPFSDNRRIAKTLWNSHDIWIRRTFTMQELKPTEHYLKFHHDDNVEVYLNGAMIYEREGWVDQIVYLDLDSAIRKNMRKGTNVLAIHCANTAGGRHLDVGISRKVVASWESKLQEAKQVYSKVNALQSLYRFNCGDVDLEVTFTSPLLLNSIETMARPVSYISYKVKSNSGKQHRVEVYLGASSDIAVNEKDQEVSATAITNNKISLLKVGTTEQPILQKKGDNIRIDWGHFYVGAPVSAKPVQYLSSGFEQSLNSFISDKSGAATVLKGRSLVLATTINFGAVASKPVERYMMLGYDEIYAVQYFQQNLRPYWNREGNRNFVSEMTAAASEYDSLIDRVRSFDDELYKRSLASGGEKYATLCALAFRQSVSAHTVVESQDKEILFLSKENYSNGSINTVDVTYPSAPLYLIYNPDLMKGMLNGIFYYSESGKWKKPFPAHDLGTYPIANGQTYGEDMPVEEAGNMILLTAAICHVEGKGDYARKHWKSLTTWAEYLEKEGLDPANQLCTDDFAGHLARNANLSVKAIVALGAYGQMAKTIGEEDVAEKYSRLARNLSAEWMKLADAGDHYALTFDDKNTWSQKYNLIWDKVLALNVFPEVVYRKELKYYQTKQNEYGIPLDNRRTYTKSDWIIWTATLSDSPEVFEKLVAPVYRFAVETTDRVPLSDWHETTTGRKVGFQARSVVGGYFMKMLKDQWQPGGKSAFHLTAPGESLHAVRSGIPTIN